MVKFRTKVQIISKSTISLESLKDDIDLIVGNPTVNYRESIG